MGQIIVGAVKFDTVEPSFRRPARRLSIAVNNFLNLLPADSRQSHPGSYGHIACYQNLCRLVHPHTDTALPELDSGLSSGFMNGIRQTLQPRDIFIL